MKWFRVMCLLSAACVLFFGQTCLAAESAFNWTGPYLGLHVGYGWGDADTSFTPLPTATGFGALLPQAQDPGPSGVFGGIQGGYNYQYCNFVFGIEADFSGSGISGTKTVSPITMNNGLPYAGGGSLRTHQDTSWFGTLRPRIGYAVMPQLLVYGTGGLAFGDVNYSAHTDYRPVGTGYYPASFSKTKVGWTVGGGAEYAIHQHWTVKAEYLYTDLGSESIIAPDQGVQALPFAVGYKWNTTSNLFRVGVNYKF